MRCRLEETVVDEEVRTSHCQFAQGVSVEEIHPKLHFKLNWLSGRTMMPLLLDARENLKERVVAFE